MEKKHFMGIIIAIVIAAITKYMGWTTTVALFIGILINYQPLYDGATWIEKKLLPFAIMLLGAQICVSSLTTVGWQGLLLIVALMATAILSAITIGSHCKLQPKLALLLGVGSAVCGSSAIMAASPVVGADEEQVGISVATVNLLGALGIFLLPALARLLSLGTVQSAVLFGGTLQSVGNVVAASALVAGTLELATVLKMSRVAMLSVVLLILSCSINKGKKTCFTLPYFIIGFIVLAVVVNLGFIPATGVSILSKTGKWLITIAVVGIGLRINFISAWQKAKSALMVGALVWLAQIIVAIVGITLLF